MMIQSVLAAIVRQPHAFKRGGLHASNSRRLSACLLTLIAFGSVCGSTSMAQNAAASPTIERIRKHGSLRCQVSSPSQGLYSLSPDGKWEGFFIDLCRAISVAVLDSADALEVKSVPITARFSTLASGESDVIMDGATWTTSRDTQLNFNFTNVVLYDGQGFLVPAESGVKSGEDLSGATICLLSGGATTQMNLSDFFRRNGGKSYTPVTSEGSATMAETYLQGGCDAIVNDKFSLIAMRNSFPDPSKHIILPDLISKEPLAPMVREDDAKWENLIRWVMIGLITAEEAGVTSSNVKAMADSSDPGIRRLLGVEGDFGTTLGLKNDFMQRVISDVGNYGEIYERAFGENSATKLPRKGSLNALWVNGGLLYAYPIR